MGTLIALGATGLYLYAFRNSGNGEAAALVAKGFWAIVIFAAISALLGGDSSLFTALGEWSKGTE